jgi:hypothetical protein
MEQFTSRRRRLFANRCSPEDVLAQQCCSGKSKHLGGELTAAGEVHGHCSLATLLSGNQDTRFRAENNRAGEALAKNVFRRVLGIP